mgnify:CR=1 FL=1
MGEYGRVEAPANPVPLDLLVFRASGQIVVLPRIICQIVELEQVLTVIGHKLPAPVTVHGGVCLVGMIDRAEEFRTHEVAMVVG